MLLVSIIFNDIVLVIQTKRGGKFDMKNENKIFVEELAIFGGAVMLAGSTIGLVLNAFNAPSVVNIIYKGKEVSMTAYSGWDVSFDDYVLCGNCDHVKKVYVYTPKHRK